MQEEAEGEGSGLCQVESGGQGVAQRWAGILWFGREAVFVLRQCFSKCCAHMNHLVKIQVLTKQVPPHQYCVSHAFSGGANADHRWTTCRATASWNVSLFLYDF